MLFAVVWLCVMSQTMAVVLNKPIFLIVMQDQSYTTAISNADIQSLVSKGQLLSNYHSLSADSQPNYLALLAGATFGATDATFTNSATTLVDLMENGGVTWKAYAEDMPPSSCYLAASSGNKLYVRRHNPFVSFTTSITGSSRCAKVVPASQLEVDMQANQLPQFSFYIPNVVHGGGGDVSPGTNSSSQYASEWLSAFVNNLRAHLAFANVMTFVVFDRPAPTDPVTTHTLAFILDPNSAHLRGTIDNQYYDHYAVLRSIEYNFGLNPLGPYNKVARGDARSGGIAFIVNGTVIRPVVSSSSSRDASTTGSDSSTADAVSSSAEALVVTPPSEEGLSSAAQAGIVVTAMAALALSVFFCFWCRSRRRLTDHVNVGADNKTHKLLAPSSSEMMATNGHGKSKSSKGKANGHGAKPAAMIAPFAQRKHEIIPSSIYEEMDTHKGKTSIYELDPVVTTPHMQGALDLGPGTTQHDGYRNLAPGGHNHSHSGPFPLRGSGGGADSGAVSHSHSHPHPLARGGGGGAAEQTDSGGPTALSPTGGGGAHDALLSDVSLDREHSVSRSMSAEAGGLATLRSDEMGDEDANADDDTLDGFVGVDVSQSIIDAHVAPQLSEYDKMQGNRVPLVPK